MDQIWMGLIVLTFFVMVGLLILLFIELRRATRFLKEWLETMEGITRPALEELQQTLKSLRSVSGDMKDVTDDIKTLSGSVRDAGQNIRHISRLIEDVTSFTVIRASGLRAGIRAALEVLLNNLFPKKGGGR